MDSPLVAGFVTIVGGLVVLADWDARISGIRALLRPGRRTKRIFVWPIYRWLGWLSDMSRTTDSLWASGNQCDGVNEGNLVPVRAVVNSLAHDFQVEGKHSGWLVTKGSVQRE
jgi:hypothetical protein